MTRETSRPTEPIAGASRRGKSADADVDRSRLTTALLKADEPNATTERPWVARVARWIPTQRLRRAFVKHPWTTLAGAASLCVPLVVAFIPIDRRQAESTGAALDDLPISGRVEIHQEPATARLYDGDPGLVSPPTAAAGGPQALQPGWELPQNPPGTYSARHASYRDDQESAGSVQTVGSQRAATAPARGAWLTGTIEEAAPPRPQYRSTYAPR